MSNSNSIFLTKFFLKLDFRNSEDSGMKKFASMMITYLFINTMVSFSNYERFDINGFIISSLTINLFLIGFVVISDYAELFFSPKHSELLKSLPIKEETIFVSKISSAFLYLSVYPLVVTLPPAVYVYFYNSSAADSLMFIIISFSFSYFIIAFIFLVNSLFVIKTGSRSRIMILFLQVLFIAFIFSLNKYSVAGRTSEAILNLPYIKFLPQYYLLLGFYNFFYLSGFIAITIMLFLFIYYFLKQNYFRLSEIINTTYTPKTKERRMLIPLSFVWVENLILKSRIERASFELIKNHFRNTSVLKYRLVPVLFLPLIATAVTVFSGVDEMLIMPGINESVQGGILILSPAITLTLLISARLLFANLIIGFEGDENTDSLYASLPIKSRFEFQKGVLKFVSLYMIIPLIIVCCGLVMIKIPSADVAVNFLYVLLFILLFNSLFARFEKHYPFSVPVSRFNNSTKYVQLLIAIALGIVLTLTQVFVFKNFIFFITAIFVILVLIILLNKIYK